MLNRGDCPAKDAHPYIWIYLDDPVVAQKEASGPEAPAALLASPPWPLLSDGMFMHPWFLFSEQKPCVVKSAPYLLTEVLLLEVMVEVVAFSFPIRVHWQKEWT